MLLDPIFRIRLQEGGGLKNCPQCGEAQGFRVKATESGTIYTCNACLEPTRETDDDGEEAPIVRVTERQVASPIRTIDQRVDAPASPINVLKLARARLKAVKLELRAKAKLEAERDELERLIKAATSGKTQKDRGIRTVAGLVSTIAPRHRN